MTRTNRSNVIGLGLDPSEPGEAPPLPSLTDGSGALDDVLCMVSMGWWRSYLLSGFEKAEKPGRRLSPVVNALEYAAHDPGSRHRHPRRRYLRNRPRRP